MTRRDRVLGFLGVLVLLSCSSFAESKSCIFNRQVPGWLLTCGQTDQSEPEKGYYLVELQGDVTPQELPDSLRLKATDYVPENAYLEWLSSKESRDLPPNKARPTFLSVDYKIDPALIGSQQDCGAHVQGNIWFWYRNDRRPQPQPDDTFNVTFLEKEIGDPVTSYSFFQVTSPSYHQLVRLARLPQVVRVEPAGVATLRNATTSWVVQTNQPGSRLFFDRDIRGQGQVIGFIDDLVDLDHCFFQPPKFKRYRAVAGGAHQLPTRHGTFVAGILAGRKKDEPRYSGNGQAPEALLSFDFLGDVVGGAQVPKLFQALQKEYDDKARIFSNSWGDDSQDGYTGWVYEVDTFSYLHEDALVLFARAMRRK